MTTTLTVSASGRGYHCALLCPDGTVHSDPIAHPHLATGVAQLFDRAGLTPSALEELRLDLGPGSYTGLRVAVTFARALQAFAGVQVLTATSLELLALRAHLTHDVARDKTIRVILDARRQRFHHAAVRVRTAVDLLDSPAAVAHDKLLVAIGQGEVLLIEEAIRPSIETVAKERSCTVLAIEAADRASMAELLLHPLLAPRAAAATELEPLYLMGSYAD